MKRYCIDSKRGAPTLKIDGKATAPVLYALSDFPAARANTLYAQKNIAAFSELGINLISLDACLHIGWRKVSAFNSEPLIEELNSALDANPNAKILLRLHVNPPYWWLRDNPEECIVHRTMDGDVPGIDDGESDRLIRNDFDMHIRVSLASELWRNEASERIKIFLEDLKGTRAGNSLMAVQIACGCYGEWHQWGIDVSMPMKRSFVSYLKEKYVTDDALRAAWGDSEVTFETAVYSPEVFARTKSGRFKWGDTAVTAEYGSENVFEPLIADDGCIRDPRISMSVIDSQTSAQMTVSESIIRFCRAVKDVMPEVLCGCFYGYYLNNGDPYTKTVVGHLLPQKLYDSETVDFLCGPFCYTENRKPWGVPMQRALLESHRLRGMLWLTEMDQEPAGTENMPGGDPERFDETVAQLRRNTLQPLLAGQGFWYFDHRIIPTLMPKNSKNPSAGSIYRKVGWWESRELLDEIEKIQTLAKDISEKEYEGVADVLLVYDTESPYYRTYAQDEDYKLHEALVRSGAVFDCIYRTELALADMDRYKCVIFVNSVKLTETEREDVLRLTKGRFRVFLGAHGYCDGNELSLENISRAVGIRLKKTDAKRLADIGCETDELLTPHFAIDDSECKIIARWDNGEPAAAVKGDVTYYPLPYVHKDVIAELLKEAGVHVWCESGEPVIAGGGYAAINCQRAGERELILPNGKAISVKSDGYATKAYKIADGMQVL